MSDASIRTGTKLRTPCQDHTRSSMPLTYVRRLDADGVQVFYRVVGEANAPVILLLHGFPASSLIFREHRLGLTIEAFTEALNLERYAILAFDYGAPTGFCLAMTHPDQVTATILQNGNAYEEGLGDAWGPIRKYWAAPTSDNRDLLRQTVLTEGETSWRYTHGAAYPEGVAPESYTLDRALLERQGNKEIPLDLFLDYASNVKLYPKFHEDLRKSKPPLLAIWGKNDPFFVSAGAEAFREDLPNANFQFLEAGHFTIETHATEIAAALEEFLEANCV